MGHRRGHRFEVKFGTRPVRAERSIDHVVQNLGRCAHDHDLVLKESAVLVVGVPKFCVENLVERPRQIGVVGAETEEVGHVIARDVSSVADLGQAPGRHRIENLRARVRREAGQLSVGQGVGNGAGPEIERVGEKVDVTDPRILHLGRRDEDVVRHDRLHGVGGVEVRRQHDFAAVAIERGVKGRVAVVRRIEDEIEKDEPRAGSEKSVEEQGIDFARPGESALRHELKGAVVLQFAGLKWRQLQGALVDPKKNEIVARRRFAALLLEEILKPLLARPDGGDERQIGRKVQGEHEPRPEKTDRADDQQPMPAEPMHPSILGDGSIPASAKLAVAGRREKRLSFPGLCLFSQPGVSKKERPAHCPPDPVAGSNQRMRSGSA